MDKHSSQEFEALLEYLKRARGFDFSGYKRASLMRRVNKRMQAVHVEGYQSYIDFLEVHPEEFATLFNTILINVTGFFRDPPMWEYVAGEIVPRILDRAGANGPIRIWSAGCASGEETYTLAMMFAETLGIEPFVRRVKVFGTDADEEALNQARQATYSAKDIQCVPEAMASKYFDRVSGNYVFNKDLRRTLIFGRHDLTQDAPISRIDLLVCRNTLMYFNSETQAQILERFHFALNDGGFMFLGKAEMLFSRSSIFSAVDLKRRIFTRIARPSSRDRLLAAAQSGAVGGDDLAAAAGAQNLDEHVKIREAAFHIDPVAQIVIDPDGFLVLANDRARVIFRLSRDDLGKPIQDLELSYRPVELRSLIEQSQKQLMPVTVKDIVWNTPAGEQRWFDVQVVPLLDAHAASLGIKVIFADISRYKKLQEEIQHSHQELETAYEELQSTNEEKETANEELQSTVEELETTNEELQSTNEELETMNEELQSTNEELQTTNDELRQRSLELNRANGFLSSILTSLHYGVVVLNAEMQIEAWNNRAEDLWGLRSEEVVGKNFMTLDIGLPVDRLKPMIRAVLSDSGGAGGGGGGGDGGGGKDGGDDTAGDPRQTMVLPATNRRGKAIDCKVLCTPLRNANGDGSHGAILLMEDGSEPAATGEIAGNAKKG